VVEQREKRLLNDVFRIAKRQSKREYIAGEAPLEAIEELNDYAFKLRRSVWM
jgi:hypothetical protein